MKKFAPLAVLLFAAVAASAAQPVLVKSPFNTYNWYAYIPLDADGNSWARWDLMSPPIAASGRSFCIQELLVGNVRPGMVFYKGISDYNDVNFLSNSNFGWKWRESRFYNSYAQAVIPSGHNVIQIWTFNVTDSGATLGIAWNDGDTSDLDVTSFATNDATHIVCTTLATNATRANDILAIRATIASQNDELARIIGFRSFNSHAIGNPATSLSGKAVGHDLITTNLNNANVYNGGLYYGGIAEELSAVDSNVMRLSGYIDCFEFNIKTGYPGTTSKFTGGSHVSSSDAPYYLSSTYPYGPRIIVDMNDCKSMWDDINNPCGKLLTGYCIIIKSDGWADWDGGVDFDDNEPNISLIYTITNTGLADSVSVKFNCNSNVDTSGTLGPEFPTNLTKHIGGYLWSEPNKIEDMNSSHTIYGGSTLYWMPAGNKYLVALQSSSPLDHWIYWYGNKKIYGVLNTAGFPGGTNPTAGSMWTIASRYDISLLSSQSDLTGDLNNDYRVDLSDFAMFAGNWLVDCYADPNNPSCVPK